jgi:hypothetical protein
MKHLIFHVTISILTFCLGLGINRILATERRAAVVLPRAEAHVKPIMIEAPAIPIAPVAPVTPPIPNIIAEYDDDKFFPDGSYYLVGRKPKDLNEFDHLAVWIQSPGSKDQTGHIMIQTYSNEVYEGHYAALGLITEKRLFFVTAQLSEERFEYRFDGEFVRERSGTYLIKGTLSKTKNGRKIAERVVTLRAEEHGC